MHIAHFDHLHRPQWTERRELFTSLSVQALGIGIVQIFLPIYVLLLGYSFTVMCGLFVFQNIVRIPLHHLSMEVLRFIGIKHCLIIGYLATIVGFSVISFAQANIAILALGFSLLAAGDSFYWSGREVMSVQLFSKSNTGKSIGLVMIVVYLSATLGPLIGGMLGERYGINVTLLLAAMITLAACAPLLATKDMKILNKHKKRSSSKQIPQLHYVASLSHNFEVKTASLLWPTFIYLIVGNLASVGILFATSLMLTVYITRKASVLNDRGYQRPLIAFSSLGSSVMHVAKIFVISLSGAYVATLAYNAAASFKNAPYASSLIKNASVYGVYRYIYNMQLFGTIANIVLWLTLIMLALIMSPSAALIVMFLLAALISPFQSLITYKMK